MKSVTEVLTTICVLVFFLTIGYKILEDTKKEYSPDMQKFEKVVVTKSINNITTTTEYPVKRILGYKEDYIRIETTNGDSIIGTNYIVEGDTIYVSFKEGKQ